MTMLPAGNGPEDCDLDLVGFRSSIGWSDADGLPLKLGNLGDDRRRTSVDGRNRGRGVAVSWRDLWGFAVGTRSD